MKHSIITDGDALRDYLTRQKLSGIFVVDTESTGLSWFSTLLGISICPLDESQEPAYIAVKNPFFEKGVPISEVRKILNPVFTNLKAVYHNAKHDMGMFVANDITEPVLYGDSIVLVHLHNPDSVKKLETRIAEDFDYEKKAFNEIIGKKWDKIDWTKDTRPSVDKKGNEQPPLITLEAMAEYACEDVLWTGRLYTKYEKYLDKDGTRDVYEKIELPIIKVLRDAKLRGVNIDVPFLKKMGVELDGALLETENLIYEEAGVVFNLNSSKQKAEILFDKMGLPHYGVTKKGAYSTDKDTFKFLKNKGFKIGELFIKYSELHTLNSTYVKSIPTMLDSDGKLRGDLNSLGTTTGRFSSSKPNLQNQPNNKKYPVRKAYIPESSEYRLMVADYSQIELRMMAHVSGDKKFIEAFRQGADIHQAVADDLNITRDQGKTVNFAVLYGIGGESLGLLLGLDKYAADEIIDNYTRTYSGYARWKKETEHFARTNGYVTTVFGRKRMLSNAFSSNKGLYYSALRQACNTVVQGSSADLIKLAMIKMYDNYKKKNLDIHTLIQVHDEMVYEIHKDILHEGAKMLVDSMTNVVKLIVPLEVDLKICNDWSNMKDKSFISLIERTPEVEPLDIGLYVTLFANNGKPVDNPFTRF